MRLYIDLDSLSVIQSAGNRQQVTRLNFKRGDSSRLDVYFVRSGTVQELDPANAETGKFGLKVDGDYPGDFIVSDTAWVKTGTGTSSVYTFEPSFNTVGLNDELIDGTVSEHVANQAARFALTGKANGYIVGQDSDTTYWKLIDAEEIDNPDGWEKAPELDEVILMAEIEWVALGARSSIKTISTLVENDVIKGDEGVPNEGTEPYPTVAELQAQFDGLHEYSEETTSSADNITLTKGTAFAKTQTIKLSVSAGVGAFTSKIILDTENAASGDIARAKLLMPASENPTIEIRNATSGGTLLYTLAGTGSAFAATLTFTFNGTAWESDQ